LLGAFLFGLADFLIKLIEQPGVVDQILAQIFITAVLTKYLPQLSDPLFRPQAKLDQRPKTRRSVAKLATLAD
jgi:hypothetical protein